jgi:hypothetical protein
MYSGGRNSGTSKLAEFPIVFSKVTVAKYGKLKLVGVSGNNKSCPGNGFGGGGGVVIEEAKLYLNKQK